MMQVAHVVGILGMNITGHKIIIRKNVLVKW